MRETTHHHRTRQAAAAFIALLMITTGCREVSPPSAQTYTVQAGDSFYRIASKTGTDPNELAAVNGMTLKSYIFPGDVLKLPSGATGSGGSSTPATSKPPTTTPPSSSSFGQRMTNEALKHVGKPYVWGASGPNTFDCSGLIVYSYAKAGRTIPRYASWMMADRATRVSKSNMKVGDLVFFYSPVSHVGIYMGNDKFVHAANSRTGVVISTLSTYRAPWFAGRL
ncbi:MAG: LysM peptidoglycan-binding domain-containing C40 family peptidase [Microthrixaceae bacterium]|nr:LysM peptidoglycan-binding domain-containing C40 family peptidase [Microthrixaceae bacterium]